MPKSLKITRPTLGTFISTPEDFAEYAKEILGWIKEGALKVCLGTFLSSGVVIMRSYLVHNSQGIPVHGRRRFSISD